MARHTELMSNLERHTGLNAKNNGINMATAIIGIVIYIMLIVPILSLMVVGALNLSGDCVIPIAIAWGLVGLYVAETFACRNIQ